jgi:hypothetical protein
VVALAGRLLDALQLGVVVTRLLTPARRQNQETMSGSKSMWPEGPGEVYLRLQSYLCWPLYGVSSPTVYPTLPGNGDC